MWTEWCHLPHWCHCEPEARAMCAGGWSNLLHFRTLFRCGDCFASGQHTVPLQGLAMTVQSVIGRNEALALCRSRGQSNPMSLHFAPLLFGMIKPSSYHSEHGCIISSCSLTCMMHSRRHCPAEQVYPEPVEGKHLIQHTNQIPLLPQAREEWQTLHHTIEATTWFHFPNDKPFT